MGERIRQFSSACLHKALSQNIHIETELTKKLNELEEKKRATVRALRQRRDDFLKRKQRRLPVLMKSPNDKVDLVIGTESRQERERNAVELISYSTGNIVEQLLYPGLEGELKVDQGYDNSKLQDTESYNSNTDRLGTRLVDTEAIECIDSSEEKLCLSRNTDDLRHVSGSKDCRSNGDERQKSLQENGATLSLPSFRRVRSQSFGNINDGSGSEKQSRLPIRVGDCVAKNLLQQSLPRLTRIRNTLPDITGRHSDSGTPKNDSFRGYSTSTNIQSAKLGGTQNSPGSPRSMRVRLRVSTRNMLTTEGTSWIAKDKRKKEKSEKPQKLKRASSTPDLIDLEPEVEHLLTSSDRTRLHRLRAAVSTIFTMNGLEDCRYLRNTSGNQEELCLPKISVQSMNQENPQCLQVRGSESSIEEHAQSVSSSTSDYFDRGQCEREGESVGPRFEPASGSDMCNDSLNLGYSNDDLEDESEQDHYLNDSKSALSLADMFQELKGTRYLRIKSRSVGSRDECDDDGEACVCPYSDIPPQIIIGHTKAILLQGEQEMDYESPERNEDLQ